MWGEMSVCEPTTLFAAAGFAYQLMSGGKNKPQQAPQVAPPPASQAPKTPDQAGARNTGLGGGSADAQAGTAGSTLLTGGQGVSPSLLALGKNTLLGA